MSISLNVVNIAAVCWTSTNRLAMVCLLLDILIISTGLPSGVSITGVFAAGCAGALVGCFGAFAAASTSCFLTLPNGSTVGTVVKSIPFSLANFLAAGEAIGL